MLGLLISTHHAERSTDLATEVAAHIRLERLLHAHHHVVGELILEIVELLLYMRSKVIRIEHLSIAACLLHQ